MGIGCYESHDNDKVLPKKLCSLPLQRWIVDKQYPDSKSNRAENTRLTVKRKCHWIIRDEVHCAFSHHHASAQYTRSVIRHDGARSAGPKKCTLRRTSIPCTHQAEKSLHFLFGSNIDKVNGSVLWVMKHTFLMEPKKQETNR